MEKAHSSLAIARHRKGWSQERVAEAIGIARSTLSQWERGEQKPQEFYVHRLCDFYQMTRSELGLEEIVRCKPRKLHQEGEQGRAASLSTEVEKLEDGSVHPDPQIQRNDIVTRREVLEFVGTTTASLAASEIFGTETLQEFARVLNKPSILEKHHLSLLEEQIALLWKYRDDGILLPDELYTTVDRHFQHIIRLLDGSLLPSTRARLLTTANKMLILKGAILYDTGRYDQAREHHRVAIQAAAQAAQPILQAIAYAWMSFSWTYEHQHLEASNAIMQALSLFSDLHEDHETFAWLTAVAAEVSANLGKYDATCSFLEQAESSLETPSDQHYTYLHQFSKTGFRGFQGVCYQVLYHPQKQDTHVLLEKALHSLEIALQDSSASVWQKQMNLVDLARVYARQGEVEMACNLTRQTIDPEHQTPRKNVLQRLTEIQQLLQPYKETSYVKELNVFFRTVGII